MKGASEFSSQVLKEKCKLLGVVTTGTKAEMFNRLMERDPAGTWMLDEERGDDENAVGEASVVASSTGSTSKDENIGLTRMEIFQLIKSHLNQNVTVTYETIEHFMTEKLQSSFALPENMKPIIRKLLYDFQTKWHQTKRTEQKFFNNNKEWLKVFVSFEKKEISELPKKGPGRPTSDFTASSERSKRRKTENIRSEASIQELAYALQMSLRAEGRLDAAKVVNDIVSGSPTKAQRYRKSIAVTSEQSFTSDSALSLFIELKFSRSQYQLLRNTTIQQNSKFFPTYKKVLQAKRNCFPPKSNMIINENSAEIKLQALLDHTVQRILLIQTDVITSLSQENVINLILICKWGCDGSSGQSSYKQKFSTNDATESDTSIFFTSVVPLQLLSVNEETNEEIVIWKNPRPSSPRFCRPIHIQFLHETTDIILQETVHIKNQEKELVCYKTVINGKTISVTYKLAFTMVDGKVCNAITSNSSSQRCYLCGATSKDFNNIDTILKREVNEEHFQFGLSTLHAWIRFFECCLHLSYKLSIKKWQARRIIAEEKAEIELRKVNIQRGFQKELGLIVDKPKPPAGNTNDGNTARRFFENEEISAAITGFDKDLIKRFHIILQTISCGYQVNATKFKEYCLETARKYVELYPWYYMPTTVHKILMHGSEVLSNSLLPIGQMSEDAQESCNKYFKRFREDFARKSSRTKNLEDVFLRLLISSDPFISSQRQLPKKKIRSLSSETLELLLPPTVRNNESSCSSESSTDHDSDDSTDDED